MPSRAVLLFSLAVALPSISYFTLSRPISGPTEYTAEIADKTVSPQAAPIVINEFLADPPDGLAGDANGDGTRDSGLDEFVEIVNAGGSPVSVAGFTISDSTSTRFVFPPGTTIPAGEAAVVFGGGSPTGSFGNAGANGLVFAIGGAGLSLANGGDSIILKDNTVAVIDSVSYGSAEGNANQSITRSPDIIGNFIPHLTAAGSGGARFSPGARINGTPFVTEDPVITSITPESIVAGGGSVPVTIIGEKFQDGAKIRIGSTLVAAIFISRSQLTIDVPAELAAMPGAHSVAVENPDGRVSNRVTFTVLGPVGINEFLADPPDGAAGDANGDGNRDSSQDEFVEIVNRAGEAADVGGFSISDQSQVRFVFPLGTIIPANESAVIFGGGRPKGEFGNAGLNGLVFVANLSLGNTGDLITLKDRGSVVVEIVAFGAAEGSANQSLNRNPDAIGTGFTAHSTIAGSGGRLFSPGARVDGSPFTPGPRIARIDPDRIERTDSPVAISIFGSGFDAGSVVLIDSSPAESTITAPDVLAATVPGKTARVIGTHSVVVRNAGGNHSNAVVFTVAPGQPILTLVTPKFVDVGSLDFTITVLGTNFEPASVVLIDETPLATAFRNSGELRGLVPAALASTLGARRVRVRNSDGRVSNELSITFVPPRPLITSLTPNHVAIGSLAISLRVSGLRFKPESTIFFDLTPLGTAFISSTELLAEVPADLLSSPGLRAVTVHNADGAVSEEAVFRIAPIPPVIREIEPGSVVEGSGDVSVKISGLGFQLSAVVRAVEGTRPGLRLPTTYISSERVEAILPATLTARPGPVLLEVENPDFGVSNGATFSVVIRDSVVINEFLADPPAESAGDANGDGTRSTSQDEFVEIVNRTSGPLDLSGYTLSDSEATRHVFAPGTSVPPFEAVVIFGGGWPTGGFGNAAENGLVFVSSTGGLSLGNNGDRITLRDDAGRVVQEVAYGPAEGNANQSINREPDADGARFLPHALVIPGSSLLFSPGARANGDSFTIKPRIEALAPASIRAGSPAFNLVVTGARFLPGAAVFFRGTELDTVRRSDSELWAEVTASLAVEGGAAEVQVRNPKGELSVPSRFRIVDDPPRIISVTPNRTGTGADNFEIRIVGERLQRGAGVIVSGEEVPAGFGGPASINATLAAKFFTRSAELEIRVRNADGNVSNRETLTVENGPLITRLARSKVKAGQGDFDLEIGGLEFKAGVGLFVNDAPVAATFVSSTLLSARIPGTLTQRPGNLELQARNPDGGRSNRVLLRVVQ